MAKIPNHLHKYKKTNIGNNGKKFLVFKCMRPACTHYLPVKLAEGKLCECNRCHDPMILNKEAILLTLPHCSKCTRKRKTSSDVDKIAEYLSKTAT